MDFGWINFFGAVIVLLILIPNLFYAAGNRTKPEAKPAVPGHWELCEQIGRYGCILLMWLPLFVWKFGFGSAEALLAYLLLNGIFIVLYYILWAAYTKKASRQKGMALALLPTAIFLTSGLLLRHWSLVAAALLFGLAHGRITFLTHRRD